MRLLNNPIEGSLVSTGYRILDEPIDRLNISRRSIKWLGYAGVKTIRDLVLLDRADILAIPNMGKGCVRDIYGALRKENLSLGLTTNDLGNIMSGANVADESTLLLNKPIALLGLSRRPLKALESKGVQSLKEVAQLERVDVESMPNIGNGSITEIENILRLNGLRFGMSFNDLRNDEGARGAGNSPNSLEIPLGFKSVSLKQLGLSLRTTNCLKSVDISSAYQLASERSSRLALIPNMGKKSMLEINTALKSLYSACDSMGHFSQERHAMESDFTNCIPSNYLQNESEEFLEAFPSFFLEFCAILDEKESAIAKGRIWPNEGELLTLEELGTICGVTRERIRQIEKRVVNKLAGFLCEDEAIRSRKTKKLYICDTKFANNWQKAVLQFEGVSETDIYSFSVQLCDIWEVELPALISVLPLIIVVFTRSTTTILSRDARDDSPIAPPMSESSEVVRKTKLSSFRIGRHSQVLASKGLSTIDDVLGQWPIEDCSASKNIISKMVKAEAYLDLKGELDWDGFRSQLNIQDICLTDPKEPEEFFHSLGDVMRSCIPHIMTWKNCREVFDMRTRLPATERATLKACAAKLLGNPSLGPAVSRIEKYLLEKLADVFVDRDFSFCPIWIPQGVLVHVSECRDAFDKSGGDYHQFCELLCEHFSLDETDVLCASAILWGTFDGLSPDRYFHLRKAGKPNSRHDIELGQKIRLAGFRSIH